YVLRKQPAQPLLADLERTEAFLGIAAPFLANTRRRSIGRPQTDRLSRALAEAGRASRIPSREPLTVSNLRLDPTTERISIDNVVVSLSKTEFALLHSLAENPGAVVEPTALISAAWDGSALPASNAVDVAVHRLRRKLARAPGGDNLVRTVRGKGYMLVPPSPR
ncbi:MAG: response regulator transcription factor, partial [Gemmatimonadetes bacterium]|nr:response regulator transcription factor [Gemmatimonadota bacterium]